MEEPQTPGSDCNSNLATDPISQDLISSEFVQDNLEYQWFIDYGYRDGGLHLHPSVLSSLSASYTRDDLGYYDDLARNLDANLAEIDMESFRTADIHTLLTALPVMCTDPVQHSESNYQRERYASMSGSVMEKLDFDSSMSPHTSSQGEDSACSTTDTMSICKSSLLFSPVKETPVLPPGASYSVDSLDCEDMLLTCQTHNKNNYTIAFEGSLTMYSDGSQDLGNQEKQQTHQVPESYYDRKLGLKNLLGLSMARSDSKIYTTWSSLKRYSANNAMTRHPSGNNNTIPNFLQATGNASLNNKKSQSLPDLRQAREAQHVVVPLNFSVDSADSNNHGGHLQSSGSIMSRSMNEDSSDSVDNTSTGKKIQNLSLVKLFIKQKSISAEGMSLTLDQSGSASDSGWPTSNSGSGSGSGSGTNTNIRMHRHDNNNACNNQTHENDFSINWVKGDYYNSRGTTDNVTETFDNNVRKQSPLFEEYEEESEASASAEELLDGDAETGSIHRSKGQRDSKRKVLNGFDARPKVERTDASNEPCPLSKTTGTQAITQVEDNCVQTSLIYHPLGDKANNFPPIRETVIEKKPVYIVYPNYTLPDLSFLNSGNANFDNIALKPQCFDRGGSRWKRYNRSGRPFSCNDIDALKQRGFSHVKDWESLTFLLPTEYKKILHDVPEVPEHVRLGEEARKPLFCLSPPMSHRRRTYSADVATNNVSSSSSTAPSSGYRGSSTILTDSSNQQGTPSTATNPLYLYRYDSVSSEASLVSQDIKHQRPSCTPRANVPMLPKRSVSMPHGDKEPRSNTYCNGTKAPPPRPPLPRSILRKNRLPGSSKRYSMFEMGGVEEVHDQHQTPVASKRMSLQEPYYLNNDIHPMRHSRIIDSEKDVDEAEEQIYYAERLQKAAANCADVESEVTVSIEEAKQLEEFLRRSGFSSQSSDGDAEDPDIKLRSYVRKFLALRMNKDMIKTVDMMESQKKTVSFAVHQRKNYSESKGDDPSFVSEDRRVEAESCNIGSEIRPPDLDEKKDMLRSVDKSVDLLLKYWHAEPIRGQQAYNEKNECAQLCLSNLCPALYAMMSDGLKPQIDTTFGPIANSVWQVVVGSSQQGPLTKTLNELVQKINSEDFMTEGILKFHAFVFGLLNLRALDAWFAYLCTRESILRKHYTGNSLFVWSLACVNAREIIDAFLDILQPLSLCPFQLDLLYQCRQLHNSFGNMNNHSVNAATLRKPDTAKDHTVNKLETHSNIPSPKRTRPRSCVGSYAHEDKQRILHKVDLNNAVKKRWSNLPAGSKLFQAFDKLASEDSEDYTDSLEHAPSNRGTARHNASVKVKTISPDPKIDKEESYPGDVKFKKLQEKWEMMIGKDESKEQPAAPSPMSPVRTPITGIGKSKIPRLLTSPVRQPTNSASGATKNTKSPIYGVPSLKKTTIVPPSKTPVRKTGDFRRDATTGRTSRVDQEVVGVGVPRSHLARPSSLPYKPQHSAATKEKNLESPHRRAASTSLPRSSATGGRNTPTKAPLKEVRTLTHRLPSDNGHLSFSEGEKLKVILEVDGKWLLCARGEHKGLVPRACVYAIHS